MSKATIVIKDVLCIPYSASGFSLFGSLKFFKKRIFSEYLLAGPAEGYKRNSLGKCEYLL